MIKSVFGLLVIGVALMPFVDGKKASPVVVKAAFIPSNSVKSGLVEYTLNSASGQTCHIKMLTETVGGVAKLAADGACDGVSAGLSKAASWIEGDKGTAQIIGSNGQTIMSVGPSDGFAYETSGSNADIVTFSES
jgi:hypothetical protein